MNNFSDLLGIEAHLDIIVTTHNGVLRLRWPVMINVDLACAEPLSVQIDGMEVLDFGYQDQGQWRITHHEPFYRWRHGVTGQGWLLEPFGSSATPQDRSPVST